MHEETKLSTHESCRLGLWYKEYGKDHFGKVDGYDEIEQPHSVVHEKAQEVLDMINKTGEIDQNEIIKRVEQVEASTMVLFNDLEKLIETKFK